MNNNFNKEYHDSYNKILEWLEIPLIDKELKKSILWKKLGDITFLKMEEEASQSDDPDGVYFRYIRQYGLSFRIKKRKLDLEKKFNLDELVFDLVLEKERPSFVKDMTTGKMLPDFQGYNEKYYEKYREQYKVIDHFGIFFDKSGEIFHFLPNGVQHGESEYNRELCSYDWENIDLNDGKPFFTLMSIEEIRYFCTKWNQKYKFKLEGTNSEFFAEVLTYWLL